MSAPRIRFALPAALLATLLAAPTARAEWPHDPYSGHVPVAALAGSQTWANAVTDGAGGAIVTWTDNRGGASYDVYAQRISAAGVPLWTANGVVVSAATGDQAYPEIASDGAGGAVIAWRDFRTDANGDVYVQRLNASGVPQWTANGVALCTATLIQSLLQIVSDGAGGAIVAWSDSRVGADDVYARRVTGAGVPQWTANGVLLCNAADYQLVSGIATDGAGGAIVVWQDSRSGTSYDAYAQRISGSGVVQWTANGALVNGSADNQYDPRVVADDAGGAVFVWRDRRSGVDYDLYAQRFTATGSALWLSSGVEVCTATGDQGAPAVTSDGAGGVVVAWGDGRAGSTSDIYAQRMAAGGQALWTSNGVAVCTATNYQDVPQIVSDGAGGAIVGWRDARSAGYYDVYAQRLGPTGATYWASGGAPVLAAAQNQHLSAIVSDGAAGAILFSEDYRSGSTVDVYCQRIERYGQLGDPSPAITGVKDVKNDQGGFVKVSWNASWLDADPTFGIVEYRLWRSVPAALVQRQALARAFSSDPDAAAADGGFLVGPYAAAGYAWELAESQAADALPSYSLVTATTADSVPGSFPKTAFMIEARSSTAIAADRWYSAPDSGYSVDNLAPAAPAPFTAQYGAGSTALHWNPNTEADLAGYRLYRGSSLAFVPGPGSFVADLADTGYVDAAGAPYVYKLTAVDAHGNESPVAVVLPSGTLGVGDAPAARAFLELAGANPARGGAALRFGLAVAGRASLALYDAAGRRVRTLASGDFAAGEHAVTWDGRDDAGRAAPAGLYFAKLETPGFTAARRIVRAE